MRDSLLISLTDSSEYVITILAIAVRISNRFLLSYVEGVQLFDIYRHLDLA